MSGRPTFHILVADDEASVRDFYAAAMAGTRADIGDALKLAALETDLFHAQPEALDEPACFEVVACAQGDEAVAAVRQAQHEGRPFAVAFLDLLMPPGPSGVEVGKAMRALDPHLNIVIVTGLSDVQPQRIGWAIPPADKLFYLVKPVQLAELRQLAVALTSKWHAEQELLLAHQMLQQQYDELESRKRQLDLADQTKSRFLATMSHELRTPLNAIIGFSEVMQRQDFGPLGDGKYLEYSAHIWESGRHLLSLINDILDISKIESGEFQLEIEKVDPVQIVEQTLSLLRNQAHEAGVAVRAVVADALPGLWADERRLKQILLNILSNAVKFTPAGGSVMVRVCMTPSNDMAISVADTGIGIPEDKVAAVLQPFTQVKSHLSRKHPGTGLGLPVAKSLTELHGGALHLASQVGKGTTITLRFPRHSTVVVDRDHRAGDGHRAA